MVFSYEILFLCSRNDGIRLFFLDSIMHWKNFLFLSTIFLYQSTATIAADDITIFLSGRNNTESVWTDTKVTISVTDAVDRWSKNGVLLAWLESDGRYNRSNEMIASGIEVAVGSISSDLIFARVNRMHSGLYLAKGIPDEYELNMTVHGKV